MNALTDLRTGWRAHPLRAATLFLTCLAAGALLSVGLALLDRARAESEALLRAWPADQWTVRLAQAPDSLEARALLAQFPPGAATAAKVETIGHVRIAWVLGPPPADSFRGEGRLPDALAWSGGERFALVHAGHATRERLRLGDPVIVRGQAYEILGIGSLAWDADWVLPGAVDGLDTWRIRDAHEGRALAARLTHADWARHQPTLFAHNLQRENIQAGLARLRNGLLALGGVIALLVGLVLHALLHADIRERRGEIGLRQALGARAPDILKLFLLEALLAGGLGAFAGAAAASAFLPLSPSLWWQGQAALQAWILLCATQPARAAAKLPPAETLRG